MFQQGEKRFPKQEESSTTQKEEEGETAPPQTAEGKQHYTRRESQTKEGWGDRKQHHPGGRGRQPKGRGGITSTMLYLVLPFATYFNLIHFHLVTRVEFNLMMLWEK